MKTIALLSSKGGAGKSTLAINLASAAVLAKPKRQALLIDLDPQLSAMDWFDNREYAEPEVISVQHTRLAKELEQRANNYQLAVIDTPPHTEQAALSAARLADLILIPVRTSILDLRAIQGTVDAVTLAGKKDAAVIVLNAANPNAPRINDEARDLASGYNLAMSPVIIHQRSALQHSLVAGLSIMEYEPESKATTEILELYGWIKKQVNL